MPRAEAGYPGKLGQIAFDGDFGGLTEPEIFTMGPTGGPFAQLTFDVLGEAEDDEDGLFGRRQADRLGGRSGRPLGGALHHERRRIWADA